MLYSEIIAVCSQIHTNHCVGRTQNWITFNPFVTELPLKMFPNCSARHGIGKRLEMLRGKLC